MEPQGIYEDRVTMLVDDGSVPEFARYGGYIAVGERMRFFTHEAKAPEVKARSYHGAKKKQSEVVAAAVLAVIGFWGRRLVA